MGAGQRPQGGAPARRQVGRKSRLRKMRTRMERKAMGARLQLRKRRNMFPVMSSHDRNIKEFLYKLFLFGFFQNTIRI